MTLRLNLLLLGQRLHFSKLHSHGSKIWYVYVFLQNTLISDDLAHRLR